MPQLDLLTILIQLCLVKFLFWSIFLILQEQILPQYIRFLLNKELMWINTNVFVVLLKHSLVLFFLHILLLPSKIFKLLINLLDGLKKLALTIKFSYFKIIFNSINLEFFKIAKLSKILNNISGHNYKLNFLLTKNKIYNYVNKYYLNEFNEKKNINKKLYSRIIVKYTRKYRLLEDETRINNLINGQSTNWLALTNLLTKSNLKNF